MIHGQILFEGISKGQDVAINVQTSTIGMGAIICNAKEKVMAVLAKKVQGYFTPRIAETKAIGVSLTWIKDVGLNLQLLDSDALTVI